MPIQNNFTKHFLIFLSNTQILDFFSMLYVKFFCVPSNVFRKRLGILFVMSILSILFAKWYFIHNVVLKDTFSIFTLFEIYLLLFLSTGAIYFRLALRLSLFFIFNVLNMDKNLLSFDILYVLGETGDNPDADKPIIDSNSSESPNSKSNTPLSTRRWTLFSYQRNHYRNYYQESHTNSYRNVILCVAVGTCAIGARTVWYLREQTEYAHMHAYKHNKLLRKMNIVLVKI